MTYRYGYEADDLFVEEGTDRVPDDGQFYILLRGRIIEQESKLKAALGRLQQLRHNPPTDEALADGTTAREKMMQGEMAARHLQQSTSEKSVQFARKGRRS